MRSALSSASRTLSKVGIAVLAAASLCMLPGAEAITFTRAPSPNLELAQVGRVAFAGNFDSISLYEYVGQNQNSLNTNGSQSLLTQYPNGAFATLAMSDAFIRTMCPYRLRNGTLVGVVVGGNFTSLGEVQAQGIALVNPDTGAISSLPGLNGNVAAVYCDDESETVYVGGSFQGGTSSNAISWTGSWTNMPFAGFNGPVTSITKASNGNIVFGGGFDGLGNATAPQEKDVQVIPLSSGNVTASGSSLTQGFSDPRNIICKTSATAGAGNSWLLANESPGSWSADFAFGFVPTKLRLYNTQENNRGTRTWRFTRFPDGGINEFTYLDPTTGENNSCSASCPLPDNNATSQDFHFAVPTGMNGFRIDISAWYGDGGGLSGIELFQDGRYRMRRTHVC